MSVQTIENFKYGLDTRRSELTSQPGTLSTCNNAHINMGGEVEKRKAFVECPTPATGSAPGYIPAFGFESSENGLVTFGSTVDRPAEIPAYPSFTATVPAFSYMVLTHPYATAKVIGVAASCSFAGKPFVLAQFNDGNTFGFYDGTVINDFVYGLIAGNLPGDNNAIATAIAAWINATTPYSITGVTTPKYTATVVGNVVTVSHTNSYSVTKSVTSTAGTLTLSAVGGGGPYTMTITVGGTWAAGDLLTVNFLDASTNVITQVGAGTVTGANPTYCYTFGNRIWLLSGSSTMFSAVDNPILFNDPNGAGNGFVDMGNYLGTIEPLISMSHYQGKLAFFARNSVQIWDIDADPAKFSQKQVLQNVGTFASLGVQPLGDLDVFFISDTGLRSVRVRDASNNAYVADLGSAIDQTLQNTVNKMTSAELSAVCTVVESSANRLWVYMPCAALGSKIYVLSYFPTSKITGWSTYEATTQSGALQVPFTPVKILVHEGKVYVRGTFGIADYVFVYDASTLATGFSNPIEYDKCIATVETPWLDAKTPGIIKQAKSVHVAVSSKWDLSFGVDYIDSPTTLEKVGSVTGGTWDKGRMRVPGRGTHYKVRLTSDKDTNEAAKVSGLFFFFEQTKEEAG